MISITQTITSLISINVAIDQEPYDAERTYFFAEECIYNNRVYRSAVDDNVGHAPPDYPYDWVDMGAANAYAMLDNRSSTPTRWNKDVSTDDSEYLEFSFFQENITHIAFVRTDAESIIVDVIDAGGNVIQTKQRGQAIWCGETNEYDYMFAPYCDVEYVGTSRAMYFELQQSPGAIVRIRMTAGDGGDVVVGDMIGGNTTYLGCVQWGVPRSPDSTGSYSRDDFGAFSGERRTPAVRMTLNVRFDTRLADAIFYHAVDTLHDSIALYVGDTGDNSMFNNLILLAKGTLSQNLDGPARSSASLTLEEAI